MKFLSSLSVLLLLTTGCMSRYKMTFDNQQVTTTHGRPKMDKKKGIVTYKDAEGRRHTVPLFTVKEIARQ